MYSLEEKNGKKKSWKKTKFSPPVFILSPAQPIPSHQLTFYTHEGLFGICLSELRPAASELHPFASLSFCFPSPDLRRHLHCRSCNMASNPQPPPPGPLRASGLWPHASTRAAGPQPYVSARLPDPPVSRASRGRDGMASNFLSTASNRRLTPPWRRHGA
jgi:hypothetical protein